MIGQKVFFESTSPKQRSLKGLSRKNYIFSEDGKAIGGCMFGSPEAMQNTRATRNGWLLFSEKYGSELAIRYFSSPVMVDNVAGEIMLGEEI